MSIVQSSVASEQRGPFAAEPERSPLDLTPVLGLGLVGLGIGMLCLGIFHGFAHGSCSTTGYSASYGPVQHCAKGTGWWMLMLMAGILATGLGALAARNITGVSGSSLLGGLLAAGLGLGGAFAIASGVSSAIGKTTVSSSVQVGSRVTVSSAAAERAREISLCKDLVAGQRLMSATDKASLTAECNTDWKAAEHQLPAAARKGALAYVSTQCKHETRQAGSAAGLPASAGATLAHALSTGCANPVKSSHGIGLKSLQAQICQQIVRARVPVALQRRALATCRKS